MEGITITDEAFKSEGHPALLLAGPGTGKTYQIAKRIKFLTDNGIPPSEITVITFTSEAAGNMRKKIEDEGGNEYIEPDKRPGRVSTMHSLGHTILSENPKLFGLQRDFKVVDNETVKRILMNDAALILDKNFDDAEDAFYLRRSGSKSDDSKKIVEMYERILRACNSIDYDDQILLACKLLRENEEIREKYSSESKYLLVDEYQDINPDQFELIKILSADFPDGLFVVGDDDQSIYRFRGGSPAFIRRFQSDYGERSEVFQMDESRRCPVNILESALSVVVKFDKSRVPKSPFNYKRKDSGLVIIHDCPSDDREAEIIAGIILDKIKKAKELGKDPGDFLILIPTKFYGEKIYSVLNRYNISVDFKPLAVSEGFSKLRTIKRWLEDNSSNITTRLVIEFIIDSGSVGIPGPKSRSEEKIKIRASGEKIVSSLWAMVIEKNISLYEALKILSKTNELCNNVFKRLIELQETYIKKDVSEFLEVLSSCTKPWSTPEHFLNDVDNVIFNTDRKVMVDKNYLVRLMSYQGAKGLEAEYVFSIGLEKGTIPRNKNSEKVAEEARLFFVAMTRAKDEIHLFHCRKRSGSATFMPISRNLTRSSFLDSLPEDKIETTYHPAKSKLRS